MSPSGLSDWVGFCGTRQSGEFHPSFASSHFFQRLHFHNFSHSSSLIFENTNPHVWVSQIRCLIVPSVHRICSILGKDYTERCTLGMCLSESVSDQLQNRPCHHPSNSYNAYYERARRTNEDSWGLNWTENKYFKNFCKISSYVFSF